MLRAITGFEQDKEGHWVALLSCGHRQHVRHKPPFIERPWVVEEESRTARIGETLDCPLCETCNGPGRPDGDTFGGSKTP